MNSFRLIFFSLLLLSCASSNNSKIDYRQEMRDFVKEISNYSKKQNPDFIVIPQNGHELLLNSEGEPVPNYLKAIDGLGQEDLNFGYTGDNESTPEQDREYILQFLRAGQGNGKKVLITDYTNSSRDKQRSRNANSLKGFITFVAPERDLTEVPSLSSSITNENGKDILGLNDAQNFLYLLNFEAFESKSELMNTLRETNYDVFILDAFFHEQMFTSTDISLLKRKANGSKRLVISYMSIGEAEDYRFYWKKDWSPEKLSWIHRENPNWPGNYKVKYWNKEWQSIITGTNTSYTQRIIDAGFDGVYLDIIDAFWYFENEEANVY